MRAVLEDVEVVTFSQFAEYCYTKNYRTNSIRAEDEIPETDTTTQDEGTTRGFYGYCGVRRKIIVHGMFLSCRDCIERWEGQGKYGFMKPSQSSHAFPRPQVSDTPFQSRKYGQAELFHDELRTYLDNQVPKDEITNQPSQHAKLYIVADKYLLHPRKELCLHKLHRDFVAYIRRVDGAGEIAELLRYTYVYTSGMDSAEGTDNELRDLVTAFVMEKVEVLVKDESFRDMLREGGDAAAGFACYVAMRLRRIKKRAWDYQGREFDASEVTKC